MLAAVRNAETCASREGGEVFRYRVNKPEALRYLGYAGQHMEAELSERIDAMIEACERQSKPAFLWRSFAVDASAGDIRLTGTSIVLEGESIFAHLSQAEECAVMVATLGLANEQAMQRLKAAHSLDALAFGAAGSSLVECVADACEADIVADAARRGLRTNFRFSPGYGDLPLAAQPSIVRVLGADKHLGLTVTDSHMLVPSKSVTALVGLFGEGVSCEGMKRSCVGCACYDCCTLRRAGHPCYARNASQ